MNTDDAELGPDEEERLLRRLGDVIDTVDGPPVDVFAAARAALSRRMLDHELAELLTTSAEPVGAAVRADDGMRLLSFRSGSVAIEIEISNDGDQVLLRGHVTGAGGDVVVDTATGEQRAPIGADGWFETRIRSTAAIRLRFVAHDGTPVSSSWHLT